MDKIWLNLRAKLSKPSANKICGSLSFKFNKISPNLVSFHAQILGLKFGEIYTQIWRKFMNKISVNLPLNLSPILNLKSKNLQFNLTKFCALGFKNFSHKDKFHTKFRAKI